MFNLTDEQQFEWLHRIELDLTTFCNFKCPSCSRGCDKFPSTDIMTVEQVTNFVVDSISLNYKWISIGLLGGEPTLNQHLPIILDILHDYLVWNQNVDIWMMTNGSSNMEFPDWLRVVVNNDHSYHHAFYVSPVDEDYYGCNLRCESLDKCGMGLGPYGYTPCVLGTGLSRIFKYPTIKQLHDVNINTMLLHCKLYCQHCGWYLVDSDDRSRGIIYNYDRDYMSPTWQNAHNFYTGDK